MQIKATSLGKKIDLRDACARLAMSARCEDEALFLAVLHNTIVAGGKITVQPGKKAKAMCKTVKGKFALEFPGV